MTTGHGPVHDVLELLDPECHGAAARLCQARSPADEMSARAPRSAIDPMPDDRTTVTELGTALGTLPFPDAASGAGRRPGQLRVDDAGLGPARCDRGHPAGSPPSCSSAFANGRAFLEAPDGLRGRTPLIIEWTGGRRPPGDEVAPIDLRIDHVYLISCKYESDILANASPARLFDGLLATPGRGTAATGTRRWRPDEFAALYRSCLAATGLDRPSADAGSSAAGSSWPPCGTPWPGAPIPTPPRVRPTPHCAVR